MFQAGDSFIFSTACAQGNAENPFEAAQRFLLAHELPLTYIDQVVKFIEGHTAGVTIGTSNQFIDPYTGGQLFLPYLSAAYLTIVGDSRYQSTSSSAPPAGNTHDYVDPFTGASRYSGAPSQVPPPPAVPVPKSLLPIVSFLYLQSLIIS